MATRGAQPGNKNAAKGKIWTAAIERALKKLDKKGLNALDAAAESLVKQAIAGDLMALKEIGDRLEGKPAQSMTLSSDPDKPLVVLSKVEALRAKIRGNSETS